MAREEPTTVPWNLYVLLNIASPSASVSRLFPERADGWEGKQLRGVVAKAKLKRRIGVSLA